MIQRVSGAVVIEDPDPTMVQAVTVIAEKLAAKFPENVLSDLIGVGPNQVWFGRGCANLRALLGNEVDETYLGPEVEVYLDESKLDERSTYQKPLVENAVAASPEGLLDVPPGGGKTVMAAILIAKLKRRTLILTTNGEIAEQFVATLKATLGIQAGFIGRGVRDIRPITVGMIQAVRSTDPILKEIGLLIVDEAHHISAPRYLALLRHCPARYRYGMTGTVKKTGDEHKIVIAAIGPVLGEIGTAELQEKGFLNKGRIRAVTTTAVGTYFDYISRRCFYYRNAQKPGAEKKCPDKPFYKGGPVCSYPKDDDIKTCVYSRGYFGWIYKQLSEDVVRNKLLLTEIYAAALKHPSMIVLTHRKEHARYLETELKNVLSRPVWLAIGTPEMKLIVRKENIAGYKTQGGVLVAMSQMLGEGFDAPKTSCLVRAMPAGGRVAVRQQTSRAMRPQELECLIIDFVDQNVPILRRWWTGRQSIYKSMGFKSEVPHATQKKLF